MVGGSCRDERHLANRWLTELAAQVAPRAMGPRPTATLNRVRDFMALDGALWAQTSDRHRVAAGESGNSQLEGPADCYWELGWRC